MNISITIYSDDMSTRNHFYMKSSPRMQKIIKEATGLDSCSVFYPETMSVEGWKSGKEVLASWDYRENKWILMNIPPAA